MEISSVTFSNFRCFGDTPTTISLNDTTVLIGENGSGKSAVLSGLARMFGLTKDQRTIQADDFFLPIGVSRDASETESLSLWIEARLTFPELKVPAFSTAAIPQHFKQMLVSEPNGDPFCRVRLSATWKRGNLPEGEIDQSLCWVTKAGDVSDKIDDQDCIPLTSFERQRIHVHYIPGARDPSQHTKISSKSLLKRLLDAAKWNDGLKTSVESGVASIARSFEQEEAIKQLTERLNTAWKSLYNRSRFSEIKVALETQLLQDFVASFTARMKSVAAGECVSVDRLSDGLRSLLYFTIVQSAFAIEQQTIEATDSCAFDKEVIDPPLLTVFAVEEPETHLAPHLLGRVIQMFRSIAESTRAQAVFTSHSSSVLARISPEEIRHLRLDSQKAEARLSLIPMPEESTEAEKFVRQAVRAYPELYFARLVVFGEGDSEEAVLARLLDASGLPSDPNVISIVPLGGRHVNHFWRLLNGLSIPHITLLDLDWERDGGGWTRIHYACNQLIEIGHPRQDVLGETSVEQFASMANWTLSDPKLLSGWLSHLERFGVFFSSPIDLDYSMLRTFETSYQAVATGAPRALSQDPLKRQEQISDLVKAVFGARISSVSTYSQPDMEALTWYRYLFLSGSKPATHLAALSLVEDDTLVRGLPPELTRLTKAIKARLHDA